MQRCPHPTPIIFYQYVAIIIIIIIIQVISVNIVVNKDVCVLAVDVD